MWDERYSKPGFLFGKAPARFLAAEADRLTPGQTALAVGDGEGRNSVFMAQKGMKVTAVDASSVGVAKARDLAAEAGVEVDYQLADLKEWAWEEAAYDLVAAIFIQFAGPEFRDEIFAGMKRTLKPGGTLLLHGYTPRQLDYKTGGPPFAENLYTPKILRDSFSDMEIVRLEEYDAEIREGEGHAGMSALIDLVAVKPAA